MSQTPLGNTLFSFFGETYLALKMRSLQKYSRYNTEIQKYRNTLLAALLAEI